MDQQQIAAKIKDLLTGPGGTGWVESVSVLEPDSRGVSLGLELENGELWFITIEPA